MTEHLSKEKQFTCLSLASPEEKARRFLKSLSDPKDMRYYYEDGYTRNSEIEQDAAASLAVFESLERDKARLCLDLLAAEGQAMERASQPPQDALSPFEREWLASHHRNLADGCERQDDFNGRAQHLARANELERASPAATQGPESGLKFLFDWMHECNPHFGGISPIAMMHLNRGKKVAEFIDNAWQDFYLGRPPLTKSGDRG